MTERRSAARGYALAAAGAALFSLNGSMARYLLDDGVDAARLSQLRSAGSWLLLLARARGSRRRDLLRVDRGELPSLALLGVVGLAAVHATFFLAVDRLEIGPAVTIQYLAPLLLLVWLRVVHGRRPAAEPVGRGGAVARRLLPRGARLRRRQPRPDRPCWPRSASMVTFAIYMVGSERSGRRTRPVTTLVLGLRLRDALLGARHALVVVPVGGPRLDAQRCCSPWRWIVAARSCPSCSSVAALRHIPAPRVAVVATLEPVLAAVFAWIVHDELLAAIQIAGGMACMTAVAWVQTRRPDLEAESAPQTRREARFSPR